MSNKTNLRKSHITCVSEYIIGIIIRKIIQKRLLYKIYIAHFALIERNRVSRWTNTFYICRGVSIVRKIARLYTYVVLISMIYK